MNNKLKPISVYIHIPFCIRKCSYCDFASYAIGQGSGMGQEGSSNSKQGSKIEEYCKALISEIRGYDGKDYILKTIFIGGGTPSAIGGEIIEHITRALYESFPQVDKELEFSIEINPGTFVEDKLRIYKSIGINRLSIGLQSTNNRLLQGLGRIHTFEEFVSTYELARELQFTNINVDLMSGIPDLTLNDWNHTLQTIIKLNPEHISAYSLIVEESTPFYTKYLANQLNLPDEDTERNMYYLTKDLLRDAGYHRYEISNYAKKGYECKHNKVYWQLGEYIGFGIAAASCVNKIRTKNTEVMEEYLSGNIKIEENLQTQQDEMEEYMFLGLRMMEGINKTSFLHRFNQNVETIYGDVIGELVDLELMINESNTIMLTDRGIDVSNTVFEKFLL